MIGALTKEQCQQVLRSGLIGRLGCSDRKRVYIVPITYVFDDKFIIAHSREGMKVQMMRKNPFVCFEVDSIENMTNWRSVVVQGTFQELDSAAERQTAFRTLEERLMPYLLSETMKPQGLSSRNPDKLEKQKKPVVYRIEIEEMTGRYEKNFYTGNLPG